MDNSLTLHVVAGPLAGGEYFVRALGSCVIGRSRDCDLSLPDAPPARVASRRHCRVETMPAGPIVRDLGSRNGTFVNGIRIGRRPAEHGAFDWAAEGRGYLLTDGDELRVGDTVFRVAITAATEAGCLATAAT